MKKEEIKYSIYYTIKNNFLKIDFLSVQKKYRKMGIGRSAVEKIIAENPEIEAIVIDAYSESLDFWKRIGFTIDPNPQIIDGHIQDYHDGFLKIK